MTQLSADIRHKLGERLRAMYDDVVSEGVPDRFAELIRKIEVPPGKREE